MTYNQPLVKCNWCERLIVKSEAETFHKLSYCHYCSGFMDRGKRELKKIVKAEYKEVIGYNGKS